MASLEGDTTTQSADDTPPQAIEPYGKQAAVSYMTCTVCRGCPACALRQVQPRSAAAVQPDHLSITHSHKQRPLVMQLSN